jgi:hypothetical protein
MSYTDKMLRDDALKGKVIVRRKLYLGKAMKNFRVQALLLRDIEN